MDFDMDAVIREVSKEQESPTPIRAFTDAEYADRLSKLRKAMSDSDVDLILLSSPASMCWLHGYQSRWYNAESTSAWPPQIFTAVHVDHDRFIMFEVSSHELLIQRTSIATDLRLYDHRDQDLASTQGFIIGQLRKDGWLKGTVGLEKWAHVPSPAVSQHFEGLLAAHVTKIVDVSLLVRNAQRLKSDAEIKVMEEAARIADAGFDRLQAVLHPEMTELEAWGEMVLAMAREGGEPESLHGCVGTDRAYGHGISTTRKIGRGFVYADPSGVKHRYNSNVCRSFYIGEPPESFMRLSDISVGAFDVLAEVATPGKSFGEVSRALRSYYQDAGVWDLRLWIGGYQLGVAFPPDWVGEFVFTVDEPEYDEPEKFVEAGLVTNFESVISFGLIDTIVYGETGTRRLSSRPLGVTVIPG